MAGVVAGMTVVESVDPSNVAYTDETTVSLPIVVDAVVSVVVVVGVVAIVDTVIVDGAVVGVVGGGVGGAHAASCVEFNPVM